MKKRIANGLNSRTAAGIVALVVMCAASMTAQPVPASYTTGLPFTMPEVKIPSFPDHSVSIVDFGAVGNGQVMNTKAFADAIGACAKAGGGRVMVPPGVWLTGPIELASNIDFHVERGALIIFSKKFEDYPMTNRGNAKSRRYRCMSPVYGYGLENIAITGGGVLNGSGEAWRPLKKSKTTASQWNQFVRSGGVVDEKNEMWWPSKEAMNGQKYLADLFKNSKNPEPAEIAQAREYLRPDMVMLVNCKRILLDGPTFENSPAFCVHPIECEDLVIRNIHIRNEWWAQNGDGIDIGSCHSVVLYNDIVNAGDDGICLKPGGYDKERGWTAACENIVVADCIVYHAHGGFVIGSETYGGTRNVSVKNCTFVGTDVGLRFKSSRTRGGITQDIYVDGISMRDIVNEAVLFDLYYEEGNSEEGGPRVSAPVTDRTPLFEKFHIKNVVCNGARQAIFVEGLPEQFARDIDFSNITISAKRGVSCIDAEGLTFDNVTIIPETGPIFSIDNARKITIAHAAFPDGAPLFMKVTGDQSGQIQVTGTTASKAGKELELNSDVKQGAVVIKE